jgi:hypothetical protein
MSDIKTRDLWSIASEHNAQKSRHFCEIYSMYFERLRNDFIQLLEIGVHRGRSLKMWKDYFPNGNIFGIEKRPIKDYDEERIKVFVGDQGDPEFLEEVLNSIKGLPTIVIDDGSHIGKDQISSFETIFGKLEPHCGLYCIEDLCTSYVFTREGGNIGKEGTGVDYIKKLIDIVVPGRSDIKSLNVYHDLAIIGKS